MNKVLYSNCHCVAGLGEACMHVTGLLIAIEKFVAEGFTELPEAQTCTDKLLQMDCTQRPQGRPAGNKRYTF